MIGVQTPWNTPGILMAQPVAAALAAGNTVVVKPSELAPSSILELASPFEAAGFPPGVFNVVTGLGPVVGAALYASRVAKLTFTGAPVIHESIYDDMLGRLAAHAKQVRMGDPAQRTTDMGSVCTQGQFTRISGLVKAGLDEGARLVTGGHQSADLDATLFFPATILADVSNHMTIAQEEVFGPVVCVIAFRDEQGGSDSD